MTLYLTTSERALYDKLPAALKKAWGGEVTEESDLRIESEEEIAFRSRVMEQNQPGDVAAAIALKAALQRGKSIDVEAHQAVLPVLCFLIGVRGLSKAITDMLSQKPEHVAALQSIFSLTEIRHFAASMNEKFSYSSSQ